MLQDHQGEVIFSIFELIRGKFDVLIIECLAFWKAISLAFDVGFRQFKVETKPLSVVNLLSPGSYVSAPCAHILEATNKLLDALGCHCTHVGHEDNQVAHLWLEMCVNTFLIILFY